jgi:TfoX/Sxy family transcriptional regulator of competence genes
VAYDEHLADRVREALNEETPTTERKMFGGICFMVEGNMCCGVSRDRLMLRLGPTGSEAATSRPHVRPMTMREKKMRGFVFVEPEGLAEDGEFHEWIAEALDFVRTLPPK